MPEEKTLTDSLRWYNGGATFHGGAQTDPNLSLGRFRSATEIEFLSAVQTNAINGVSVLYAGGANGEGEGTLRAVTAGTLAWTPPGGTEGPSAPIALNQTIVLHGGGTPADHNRYVRVRRTTSADLVGTSLVTLTYRFNNALAFDNIESAEAAAGDTEYRFMAAVNENPAGISNVAIWVPTLGTQATGGSLPASGAGTLTAGANAFADWPSQGYCHVRTSGGATREVVFYDARTDTTLTVPGTGRGLLQTAPSAGAGTDTLNAVPGILIAGQAPGSQPTGQWQNLTNESTAPTGVSWTGGNTAATGIQVGTLASGHQYGVWLLRQVPPNRPAAARIDHVLAWSFDA